MVHREYRSRSETRVITVLKRNNDYYYTSRIPHIPLYWAYLGAIMRGSIGGYTIGWRHVHVGIHPTYTLNVNVNTLATSSRVLLRVLSYASLTMPQYGPY
jgi:hypothetical protein